MVIIFKWRIKTRRKPWIARRCNKKPDEPHNWLFVMFWQKNIFRIRDIFRKDLMLRDYLQRIFSIRDIPIRGRFLKDQKWGTFCQGHFLKDILDCYQLFDSFLSSKMTSLCVEASRIETHRDRLIELKKLPVQWNNHRFETLKYPCAHFRRVAANCHINKVREWSASSLHSIYTFNCRLMLEI